MEPHAQPSKEVNSSHLAGLTREAGPSLGSEGRLPPPLEDEEGRRGAGGGEGAYSWNWFQGPYLSHAGF